VLAAAGDAIRKLETDRERWQTFARFDGVNSLEPGPANTVIAGSKTLGVTQFNESGQALRQSSPLEVWSLARSPDGTVWSTGYGVSEIVVKSRGLEFAPVQPELPAKTAVSYTTKFDSAGQPWVCEPYNLWYRSASGWHSASAANPRNTSCWQFAWSGTNDVWYASGQPVLSFIENAGSDRPAFHNFDGGGSVGLAPANFFGSDSRGWLWRGTSDGLYLADSQQARNGQWLHIDRTDGLPSINSNEQSFREDPDGSVWFSADNSIIHFAPPADFLHPKYAPETFVSGFSLNGGALQLAPSVGDIKYGSDITALLGSLQMDRRNALHVRYRVLPEQSSWTDSAGLDLHLGKLRRGAHTLEFQAELGDGPWSKSVTYSFSVLKPFWLTWPFLLGVVVAGAASGTAGSV
jgi:hypothetical protein